MQRVPLVFSLNTRDASRMLAGSIQTDNFYSSCAFQRVINHGTQTVTYYVRPFDKYPSTVTTGSGLSTAVTAWTGKADYQVAYARGSTNSTIYHLDLAATTTGTSLGAITGKAIHMSETAISGVATIVAISDASSGRTWFYTDGGALTEITDTDFPPKQTPALTLTGNFVHLNGRPYIMTTNGQIWSGDINSLANWTANTYLSADRKPDSGVGITRFKDMIFGLGATSGEVFRDTGNPSGSQLSRIENGLINVGCVSQHCMVEYMDSVAWIGRTGTTGYGVYMLTGVSSFEKISDQPMDEFIRYQIMQGVASAPTLRLGTLQTIGKQILILIPAPTSATVGYSYDPDTKIWGPLNFADSIYKTAAVGSMNVASSETAGLLINRDNRTTFDAMEIQIGTDFGTNRYKTIHGIYPICDRTASSRTVTAVIRYDDFSIGDTITKTFDTSHARPMMRRCGRGTKLSLKLQFPASSADFRISAVDIDYSEASA